MLEFTEVFPKGCNMAKCDNLDIILKCKNIDFGHVCWCRLGSDFYDNKPHMFHITNNIIDINTHDNHSESMFPFFSKVVRYSKSISVIHYVFNNGCVNNESFEDYFESHWGFTHKQFCLCCPHKQFDKLTYYLTSVSLSKFKGYYNLEKYYDMLYTMLLILKVQQQLPSVVVKHLIIPFVYQ